MLADGVGGKGRESCLITFFSALMAFLASSKKTVVVFGKNEALYPTQQLARLPVHAEIG
jgi:uncharacterized protein YqfB (UPF0267 family)